MRSVNDYASYIEKSLDLNFTKIARNMNYDEKKNIGIAKHGNKIIRVFKREDEQYILLITIDLISQSTNISFKNNNVSVCVSCFNGHDIIIYINHKKERAYYIEGVDFICRDKNGIEEYLSYEDFNSEIMVNDICYYITQIFGVDMNFDESNTLFEVLRPILLMLSIDTKDELDKRFLRLKKKRKIRVFQNNS